ncbi:hypothetical protein ACFLRN_07890 [Thermoproteota archaeon]
MDFVWEKPVLVFYKERKEKPERRAFTVVKARKLIVSQNDEFEFSGNIKDFFPLMGDIDYISTEKGSSDQYILCWFEDKEDDLSKAWRRLTSVTFPKGISFSNDKKGKRTYNVEFKAKKGKL